MQKKQVQIEVQQLIAYADTHESDSWSLNTNADFIELETFSKLVYQDEQGQRVEVKWQMEAVTHEWIVEVTQGQNKLRFIQSDVTRSLYNTQQGVLPLEIRTHSIHWGFEQMSNKRMKSRLKIHYQLEMDKQSIGNYHFSLIYWS